MPEVKISHFKGGEYSKVDGEVELFEYFDYVKEGRWQDLVLAVRQGTGKKEKMPSVTVSGTFQDRRKSINFKTHSGIIAIDIDADDNPDLISKREGLEKDKYCLACHHSVRGFGLVWYARIDPEKHLDAFLAIEKYLANTHNVLVDPSGKDITRLRYVSYDPHLHLNKRSKKWVKYLPQKERQSHLDKTLSVYHSDDMESIMTQIKERRINICEDYHSWLNCGFALAKEFGESGREYFHLVSSMSSKYDQKKVDRQYDISLKRDQGGITMGTFFFYCQQNGIEILTETTKRAITIYRQRVKMSPGSRDRKEATRSTLEYMERMHNVKSERIVPVLEKLKTIPDAQIREQKINDKVSELEAFVLQHGFRHNQITNRIELNGKPINDRDINSVYRKAMHVIDYNLQKSKVWDVINSDIIHSYNPFLDFFDKHKSLRPEGVFDEVKECFHYDIPDGFPADKDYLSIFLKRWLLGIISSMNGTYSLLVLVLVGDQGTGKTKFFRSLLPHELQDYYTENKLESGKDADILMCEQLIIMDDEFGGKSKIEAKRFKEMSSRESFRIRRPYGRVFEEMKRYAVLCGTTNDYEVLNDTTGNRRLIPINVISFDWERFERIDKTELFMELYHEWKEAGDAWMLTKADIELLAQATEKNEQPTPEEEFIAQYFTPIDFDDPTAEYYTNTQIRVKLDQVASKNIVIRQKNLGLALNKLGYEKRKKKVNGRVILCYSMKCLIEFDGPIQQKNEEQESAPF